MTIDLKNGMSIMQDGRHIWSAGFWITATLAVITQISLAAIETTLTSTSLVSTSIRSLALAATVLNICSLVVLLTAIALRSRSRPIRFLPLFHAAAITLFLAAHTLAIYTLGWTLAHPGLANDDKTGYVKPLAIAGLVVSVVALISQSAFFALSSISRTTRVNGTTLDHDLFTPSPPSAKRIISLQLKALAPPPPQFTRTAEPLSPVLSTFSSSPRSSIRGSMNQALRPMTSKTRLLIRQSFTSGENRSTSTVRRPSYDLPREEDGFESWDTSAVEDPAQDHYFAQAGARGRLETIPGSRPVSPARALDGPFPVNPEPTIDETSFADSPLQSPLQSPLTPASSIDRPFTPPFANRRPSANTTQSQIHPLFRSESPNPPPLASPGTVIMASPFAGQIISHDRAPRRLHSAQELRAGSASPTIMPPFARPESARSLHRVPTAPAVSSPGPWSSTEDE